MRALQVSLGRCVGSCAPPRLACNFFLRVVLRFVPQATGNAANAEVTVTGGVAGQPFVAESSH